ncbi:MAG TPA: sulfotransferase [Streptosporangiaceae bacterium]
MTAGPHPATGPAAGAATGALSPPPPLTDLPGPAPQRPHILIVNGRKVRQPVFVLGAPYSGTYLLATALKRSPGFHVTLGQRSIVPVVHAFARTPAIPRGRPEAAATVLRDAFAQGWQVSPHCCLGCSAACREASGSPGAAPCVAERSIGRYGDASPDLLYCAESLVDAFPDARLVQIIRDGRDVAAAMLADPEALAWFRPGFVTVDPQSGHPLLGVESAPEQAAWEEASPVGKCAMRWRGTVRLAARLRAQMSAEQLITLRYEDMIKRPHAAVAAVSAFIGADVTGLAGHVAGTVLEPGTWRATLTAGQVAEVEQLAGEELRRVGYGS